MPFLDELDIRHVGDEDGGPYRLLSHLRYRHPNTGGTIKVPAGFLTDLASIPRGFRWLVTGHDNTAKPAVIHDYLYRHAVGKRKDADDVFLLAMGECHVPWWKRTLCYSAVRAGGWVTWRKNSRKSG